MTVKLMIEPQFHFHPNYKEIYQKVQIALKTFPELDNTEITLTAFIPKKNNSYEGPNTVAMAISDKNGDNKTLTFNVKIMPTYNAIYHELWHLVQRDRKSTKRKSSRTIKPKRHYWAWRD